MSATTNDMTADTLQTTAAPRADSARNFIAFATLLACLVAVHFVLALNPGAAKSVAATEDVPLASCGSEQTVQR